MKPEQCFRCLRTFSETNPANPKLATSLLTCIKCGQINLGKPALELHYKVCHSSPVPHTLCDGCASSLGRTTERVFRTDDFDAVKNGNRRARNSASGPATVKKSVSPHDSSNEFRAATSSRHSGTQHFARKLENPKGLDTRSARRNGKDPSSSRSRTGSPFGESAKKKHGRLGKFFKYGERMNQ